MMTSPPADDRWACDCMLGISLLPIELLQTMRRGFRVWRCLFCFCLFSAWWIGDGKTEPQAEDFRLQASGFNLQSVTSSLQPQDLISGTYSVIFRSFSDRIFSGTDVRREEDYDRFLIYDYLNIQKVRIFENEDWRVFGSGSAWLRVDLDEQPARSRNRADLSYGYIQIDRGRTADGFIRLGRIYNYQGILHQRFDGGEIYYPINKWLDLDVYGGSRPYETTEAGGDSWLTGGRAGLRFSRRGTVGFSWLLAQTDDQWDDQKIGGDWRFSPWNWLELSGFWGYDLLSEKLYDVQTSARIGVTSDLDLRFTYDDLIPGLYIPKSSIFSVYSLAEETSYGAQVVYHPGDQWNFMTDLLYIDYHNEGGEGGPRNFYTAQNAIDGGYQWRWGIEAAYRFVPNDEVSLRFEQLLEGTYGYTVTDLIRNDFDFRDYVPFPVPPEDEGFVFGKLENGFSSIGLHHWHQWTEKFSHALNFYYYMYDNPLYLHRTGEDSYSTNVTLSYKINSRWSTSTGGRYLSSLTDQAEWQYYLRIVFRF